MIGCRKEEIQASEEKNISPQKRLLLRIECWDSSGRCGAIPSLSRNK